MPTRRSSRRASCPRTLTTRSWRPTTLDQRTSRPVRRPLAVHLAASERSTTALDRDGRPHLVGAAEGAPRDPSLSRREVRQNLAAAWASAGAARRPPPDGGGAGADVGRLALQV